MKFAALIIATVVRVIDGDTLVVDLPCDIDLVCKSISVRAEHIDTPEIRGKCDKEKDLARQAKKVMTETFPSGDSIILKNTKRDKYFRILANIPEVRDELIAKGLARDYEGGKKLGWCDE